MRLRVCEEDPRQGDVALLLQQSDALAAVLYPGEYRRPLDPEALAAPGIHVLVARDGSVAVGCCAVIEAAGGTAELKRMIVDARARRQGVGMALLQAAEATAVELEVRRLRMEVEVKNTDGEALYRRTGFVECGPFGGVRGFANQLVL